MSLEIFFNTDDSKHKFGEVNQATIVNDVKSIDVLSDGNIIHTVKINAKEKPIAVKRTNLKEGVIYLVGTVKNNKQKLTLIRDNGEIIKEKKKDHIFHGDVELHDWQKIDYI